MKLDSTQVNTSVYYMRKIANELDCILQEMNYYYTGSSVDNQGAFSTQFERLRSTIYSTTSDIRSFIQGYADLVAGVADNFELLDEQMGDQILNYLKGMEG